MRHNESRAHCVGAVLIIIATIELYQSRDRWFLSMPLPLLLLLLLRMFAQHRLTQRIWLTTEHRWICHSVTMVDLSIFYTATRGFFFVI